MQERMQGITSISFAAFLRPRAIVSIPTMWAMNKSSTSVLSLRLKYSQFSVMKLWLKKQTNIKKYRKIVKDSQFRIKVESTWCNSSLEKAKTRQSDGPETNQMRLHSKVKSVSLHDASWDKKFHTFLITLSIIIVASWISTRNWSVSQPAVKITASYYNFQSCAMQRQSLPCQKLHCLLSYREFTHTNLRVAGVCINITQQPIYPCSFELMMTTTKALKSVQRTNPVSDFQSSVMNIKF